VAITVEMIRDYRERREAVAAEIALGIKPGKFYYASGCDVIDGSTQRIVASCDSHWDAALVVMAIPYV
jgi:hypothetical protein